MTTPRQKRVNSIFDDEGNRRCFACKVYQPPEQFGLNSKAPDKLSRLCRSCVRAQSAARRARDPEAAREAQRKYRANPENRAKIKARARKWEAANVEKVREIRRAGQLKGKFGLSREGYATMREAQGGVCAICKKPQSGRKTVHLVVDHAHDTNQVRGLLCSRCNVMIGYALEDPDVLLAAVEYLRNYEA